MSVFWMHSRTTAQRYPWNTIREALECTEGPPLLQHKSAVSGWVCNGPQCSLMFVPQGILRWSRTFAWGRSSIQLRLPDEERGNENLLSHIGASRFSLWGQRLLAKTSIIFCSTFFCVCLKVIVKDIWEREEGGGSRASERTTFRCKVYFSTTWRVLHEQCPVTGCVHPLDPEGSPQRLTRLRQYQCVGKQLRYKDYWQWVGFIMRDWQI